VIWDVAGAETFGEREFAYLRGASGFIYVADGTRPMTTGSAERLRDQIDKRFGESNAVMLVNKCDLTLEWSVSENRIEKLQQCFDNVYKTSAKTGEQVAEAMRRLSRLIINNELRER